MANKIRLTVGGIQYSVVSEDSEEYIKSIGRELEMRMNYFAKKNPFLSTTMTAVLAAMEGFDTAHKAEEENERLKAEVNKLLGEIAVLRSNQNTHKAYGESDTDYDERF